MRRVSTRTFVLAGVTLALVLAFLVAPYASSSPDGLEKVVAEKGLDLSVKGHDMAESPLAGYSVRGFDSSRISTGLAGIVGVGVTFALGVGLFAVVRVGKRVRTSQSAAAP